MTRITNVKVYDFEESVIACRYAMRTELPSYAPIAYEEEFKEALKRAKKLASAPMGSGHQTFLSGIRVSFDLVYPNYLSPELQRYHFVDIVTSSSKMHRIMKMDFRKCCNEYVTTDSIAQMEHLVKCYNGIPDDEPELKHRYFMMVISNCPQGVELFMRISTNYLQLKTIYHQRKNHRLKEDWGVILNMIRSLPFAKDFITGE